MLPVFNFVVISTASMISPGYRQSARKAIARFRGIYRFGKEKIPVSGDFFKGGWLLFLTGRVLIRPVLNDPAGIFSIFIF
ncbi:hypothetical protein DN748_15085 [Sinomicrobium soli]|nr:hypothetical protein DN748_15085 [Sinomicrobium sp. N-1-3-6]